MHICMPLMFSVLFFYLFFGFTMCDWLLLLPYHGRNIFHCLRWHKNQTLGWKDHRTVARSTFYRHWPLPETFVRRRTAELHDT